MVCCTVLSCKNNHKTKLSLKTNKVPSFHHFPRDEKRTEQWLQACGRDKDLNLKRAVVCSDHFLETDFERDLQAELLNLPVKKRLNKTAIPSQYLRDDDGKTPSEINHTSSKNDSRKKRDRKKVVKSLFNESTTKKDDGLAHCNLNNRCIFCLETPTSILELELEKRNDLRDFTDIWPYILPNWNDNHIHIADYSFLNRWNGPSKIPTMCSTCQDQVLKVAEHLRKISALKLELEKLEKEVKRLGVELRKKTRDSPETPRDLRIYASRYKTLLVELKEKASSKVMENTITFLNQLRGYAVDISEDCPSLESTTFYMTPTTIAILKPSDDNGSLFEDVKVKTEDEIENLMNSDSFDCPSPSDNEQEIEEKPDIFPSRDGEVDPLGGGGGAIENTKISEVISDPLKEPGEWQNCQNNPDEMESRLKEQHQVQEVIRCKFCPSLFPDKDDDLILHLVFHCKEDGIGIPCDIFPCSGEQLYLNEFNIKKHFYSVHGIGKKLICEWESCQYSCFTGAALNKHLVNVHKVAKKKSKSNKRKHECGTCGKKLSSQVALHRHIEIEHGNKRLKCSYETCDRTFKLPCALRQHEKTHLPRREKKMQTLFKCLSCEKSFKFRDGLRSHVKYFHLKEKGDHICNICGGHYRGPGKLLVHMRIHTGERPHKCHICGQGFRRVQTLRKHLRSKLVHNRDLQDQDQGTKKELHECQSCGKGFRFYYTLKKHVNMVHDAPVKGEKPRVKCSSCEKSFAHEFLLKQHVKYFHEGKEGEHICEVCGKRFKSSGVLNLHKRVHTGERPYQCHACGEKYRYMSNLKRHLGRSKCGSHGNEESVRSEDNLSK